MEIPAESPPGLSAWLGGLRHRAIKLQETTLVEFALFVGAITEAPVFDPTLKSRQRRRLGPVPLGRS